MQFPKTFPNFAENELLMKTRKEYIEILTSCVDDLKQLYGVTSMLLFGSVAREQQTENSDVDVCVEMPPRLLKLVAAGQYLEEKLGCRVDVIRRHSNMNPVLMKEIENDGVCIFK